MKLTHIDLFSGVGGFSLAAQWAGFETIVFCENDEYCQKVIQKRFGGYVADSASIDRNKRFELGSDRRKKEAEQIRMGRIPIIQDIRDFDGTKWRGATLLTGGFPCQPFSAAGKRKGKDDDRHLWPEMFRVIEEAKPRWVIAENVRGIVNMELGQVLSDLEAIGYDFPRDLQGTPIVPVIPAAGVNAPHRRDRVWIVAYNIKNAINSGNGRRDHGDTRSDASNSGDKGLEGSEWPESFHGRGSVAHGATPECRRNTAWEKNWVEIATRFCRVDDGLPPWVYRHRTRRLKALGNAIVPQVAYEIIKGIAEIECT